jgi:hypothetical protein
LPRTSIIYNRPVDRPNPPSVHGHYSPLYSGNTLWFQITSSTHLLQAHAWIPWWGFSWHYICGYPRVMQTHT